LPIRFSCSPCAVAARRSAAASSVDEVKVVSVDASGQSRGDLLQQQPLPSGSLNEANERSCGGRVWTANPEPPNKMGSFVPT